MARFFYQALALVFFVASMAYPLRSDAALPVASLSFTTAFNNAATKYTTLISACQSLAAAMPGATASTTITEAQIQSQGLYEGYFCQLTRKDGGVENRMAYVWRGQFCPANASYPGIGSNCTCNSGYFELGGSCIANDSPDAKCAGDFNMSGFGVGMGKLSDTVTLKGDVGSGSQCYPYSSPTSGCTVQFTATKVVEMPDGSKQTVGQYGMYKGQPGEVQGKACDIPAEQPGEGTEVDANCKKSGYAGSESVGGRKVCLDPPDCPGGYGGEVNGLSVCVKDQGTNVTKTEKNTETKNKDGSTDKVTEKTSCQGKACTTEKTTTNTPAGGGSSTVINSSTVVQSKEDYCKSNANSAQCNSSGNGQEDGKGGSFGGSCDGGFTCEGDALQCAQVREQYKRNCEAMDKDKDSNSLTNKALNGTDDKSADAMKASAGQVNVGSTFDQSGLGWSHSCPADPRIALNFGGRGSEFSIPFSRICGPLGVLSLAGVGITLLGCGVWVLGGKKGS